MSDKDTLLSMGFPADRVAKAVKVNKGSLGELLDYLEKHADQPESWWAETGPEEKKGGAGDADSEDEGAAGIPGAGDVEAKSIKCTECGKIFRNTALAQYHGTKSGHSQFEESTEELKPLTEEEKAAKLAELRVKMDEKRRLQAVKDAAEAKQNEDIRRKSGKDEAKIKAELQLKEANLEALKRKKEKADDIAARARIKAQIELDKQARAAKSAREKALREGRNPDLAASALSVPSAAAAQPSTVIASAPGEKKEYVRARLQLRVPQGQPIVHSAPAESTLREVVEHVKRETGMESVTLTSTFPRKTFTDAELDQDLKSAGLVPSAVLIVS